MEKIMDRAVDLDRDAADLRRKYLEERDKRLRSEGVEQYVGVEGQFADYGDDPHVAPGFTRAAILAEVDAVVVGGGFSGLLAASSLLKAGVENIRLIEKAGDFGGTWYWNRYPGCRCDVDAYTYLPLIEDVGRMPEERYSRSDQIFEHAKQIGRSLGLYDKSLLQTGVTKVSWDESISRWIITTDRDDVIKARFVALATGILNRPKLPGIPGVESFEGHAFHTSRWDFAYTGGDGGGRLDKLADKRVAIIGTGASAAQAIPHLGEWAKELYVVQRTPAAVDDRASPPTDPHWWNSLEPGWWERRARNFEGFVIGMPQKEDLVADGWTKTWAKIADAGRVSPDLPPEEQKRLRQLADFEKMSEMRARIDRTVKDRQTAESLKPYFNWMCKRPLFVSGYFETYNRPNVKLIDTRGKGLDRITESAIVFDGKSYDVDCIIYASGFEVAAPADRTGGFELVGKDDTTLAQNWAGGIKSLHGMFVRGFPNLAIINGLKQASITWSITFMMRKQSEHFAKVVRRCLDDGVAVFDVKDEAEREWKETLLRKHSVDEAFLRDCTPGYYNNEGKNLRDSIWASSYGGGPFEYMDLLQEWREKHFERDVDRTFVQ